MKICLGQINTTPGDFAGNLAALKKGVDVASTAQCDFVVFPELSIPGYLSQDLLYRPGFIDQNLAVLEELREYTAEQCDGLHVVCGYVTRNLGIGKPFHNVAGILKEGKLIGEYRKQLLPFYDVFDELRYFEPGDDLLIVEILGKKVGIAICEDLWNDKGSDDYVYENNPLEQYRAEQVDVVLSLNSSPFVHGKSWQRLEKITPGAVRTKEADSKDLTIVYVNQRGGQDELVFDGQSFIVKGRDLLHLSEGVFEDTFDVVDISNRKPEIADVANPGNKEDVKNRSPGLRQLLVLGLRDYVQKTGFDQLVLASSGGVDSAVVCMLACEAIGASNVHAIRMPSIYSSDHAATDAIELHQNLGCWDYEVEIEHQSVVDMLQNCFERHVGDENNLVTRKVNSNGYSKVADENIQARLRDLYVMHFSNAYGAMPLSTGNKTESACGYYTHFDMNFSFAPIKDIYKFQVFDLAKANTDIPENIWQKPPSAELAHGQTDEASLLPYSVLDPIVQSHIEDHISEFVDFIVWVNDKISLRERISADTAYLAKWLYHADVKLSYQRIISLIGKMEYKRRQTCPGTKVSKIAFGIGRRLPIVEKWS
ncbi:MAG: NAD+ synthase (glutamine-hydrolyzing) [Candidatus Azotimanducaceae bacterium]|jgi:NAD+ synthase (glutamine-hydrolysing)